jgi:hypothetical protein
MGGGQQAQAPQYDPTQSTQATRDQLQAQYDFMAPMARQAGQLSNEQTRRNIASTVNLLRNPAGIYAARIQDLERDSAAVPQNKAANDRAIAELRARDPVADIRAAYSDAYRTADELETLTRQQSGTSAEYRRAQDALRQGVNPRLSAAESPTAAGVGRARDVSAENITASQANFVNMRPAALAASTQDVSAGQVAGGRLGSALMGEAVSRVQSGGRLSAEASRDAVQAARSGMAARGMATGSAGLAAELLNRDRYTRARSAEDLAFAQNVQGQDIDRQFTNVGNRLRADQQNQQLTAQRNLANQSAINQARELGYTGAIGQRQFNTAQQNAMRSQFANNALQASMSNQGADQARNLALSQNQQQANVLGAQLATQNNQFNAQQRTGADMQNVAYLQAGSALANQEGARRMGALQDLYNFQFQTDPRSVMLTGTPFANMAGPGMQMASNAQFTPMYTGGQFSSGGIGGALLGGGMGAVSGAMAGAPLGPWGIAGGALVGGLGGAIGGSR